MQHFQFQKLSFLARAGGGIRLISEAITELLNVPVSVLMGANLAGEVADGHFCETTIGTHDAKVTGPILKTMFQVYYDREKNTKF